VLYQNGAAVNTGFTPATFSTTAGQQYTVEVQDYGSYYFNHWSDGSTNRDRTFTATSLQTFTAVYSTSPQSGGSGDTVGSGNGGGSSGSAAGVTVASTDQNGKLIYGYYTLLCQQGTSMNADGSTSCDHHDQSFISSGFTTVTFNGLPQGQTFGVEVQDYDSCTFNHWTDSPNNVGYQYRFHLFTAASPPNTLTAVYNCS
jgi:hypothetical protein